MATRSQRLRVVGQVLARNEEVLAQHGLRAVPPDPVLERPPAVVVLLTFAIYAVLFSLFALLPVREEAGVTGAVVWALGVGVLMTLGGQIRLWLARRDHQVVEDRRR